MPIIPCFSGFVQTSVQRPAWPSNASKPLGIRRRVIIRVAGEAFAGQYGKNSRITRFSGFFEIFLQKIYWFDLKNQDRLKSSKNPPDPPCQGGNGFQALLGISRGKPARIIQSYQGGKQLSGFACVC